MKVAACPWCKAQNEDEAAECQALVEIPRTFTELDIVNRDTPLKLGYPRQCLHERPDRRRVDGRVGLCAGAFVDVFLILLPPLYCELHSFTRILAFYSDSSYSECNYRSGQVTRGRLLSDFC